MQNMKERIGQAKLRYLSLWNSLKGWRLFLFYIAHYTVLFVILQRFIFAAFAETGKSFAWNFDGVAQHYTRLAYIRQIWRANIHSLLSGQGWTLPLYDFHSGPALMDTQIGLPQILVILWPYENIDLFYQLYVLFNYYCVGLAFSAFGFYWKQKPLPVLIGAVSYAFSGIALYAGVRHPHFIVPMAILPLLLIGAEKILRQERSWVFSIAVFLSLTTQWGVYFSYMQAVFVLLYVVIRFFDLYPSHRLYQALGLAERFLVLGGVPVLLAAVSWLPALINIMKADRVGNSATMWDSMMLYGADYYKKYLENLFLAPNELNYWTVLGFSILTLPALLLLFIRRKRQERSLKMLFVVLNVMLCVPAVGYMMSGFSNISNRFCFGLAFCAAAIVMFMAPRLMSMTRRELALVGAGTAVYFALCYFGFENAYFNPQPILLLLTATAFLAFLWASGARGRSLLLACLLVTCFSVRYTAFWLYDTSEINYVSTFYTSGSEAISAGQYDSMARSDVLDKDDAFYRVIGNNMVNEELNIAFLYGLNGATMYPYYGWSSAYISWIKELELPRRNNKQIFSARASNAPYLALMSVKYYAKRDNSTVAMPYGFSKVDSVKNDSYTDDILQNDNWLPVGYTYDQYMTRDTYDQLNGLGKQETLLSAVLLEETPCLTSLTRIAPQFTGQQISCEISTDGATWEGGELAINRDNATVTLTFDGLPKTQTYLRIVDLDQTNSLSSKEWGVKVSGEKTTFWCGFMSDAAVYATQQHTQTVDLGYSEGGLTTVTITFPSKGNAKLEDLQIWCQPMDRFEEQVAALGAETLQNIKTDWHSLRGDITVSKDKLLCLAIPYADGWTAYVDGEETKLYQANTAFMAVELPAGSHTVEIRYWMPGLTAGLIMSGAGLACLAALIMVSLRKKKAMIA